MRTSLKETKQEIIHCSFQNEAAQRVIGRLLKEKEQTKGELIKMKEKLGEMRNN